ncbi:MAG: hypothetical protein IKE92_11255 [Clostridiales bacterium]|nr:hypothetical protein [Clostridiales bacterium]
MATTEMNCLAGGGGTTRSATAVFSSINGDVTITVSDLTSIKAVFAYYTSVSGDTASFGYFDNNGNVQTVPYYSGSVALGVTNISGNTFTFKWNSAYTDAFTYVALGY